MRAFAVTKYGAPLERADVAEPAFGNHDVLVQIKAASLNSVDERIRVGSFRAFLPQRFPLILGHDLAGVVIAVGDDVTDFAVGDNVYAATDPSRIGTFAERIAVRDDDLALVPTSVTLDEAASLPLVALTAWQALVERGRVQPGDRVLIQGGAGGVGSIAVQLAKHLGAIVTATASASNLEFVRSLGADHVVDYRARSIDELVHDQDLVLDSVGGATLEASLRTLRPGGRAIGIVGPPDAAFARERGLNPLLRFIMGRLSRTIRSQAERLGVTYEFLFVKASGSQLREIRALVDAGAIRPVVGRVIPFDDAPAALANLGRTSVRGKTVLSTTTSTEKS